MASSSRTEVIFAEKFLTLNNSIRHTNAQLEDVTSAVAAWMKMTDGKLTEMRMETTNSINNLNNNLINQMNLMQGIQLHTIHGGEIMLPVTFWF